MLTQRAFLLGVVAFCFYLIAVVNTLPGFYYLLTWLALGLLAASLGIAILSLAGLRCALSLPRAAGTARWPGIEADDDDIHAPRLGLELQNTGTLNKTGLILELRVVPLEASDSPKRGKARPLVMSFLIEALPSGASQRATVPLGALGRGRFQIVSARLVASDVLGLFRAFKTLPWPGNSTQIIVVAPSQFESAGHRQSQRYASGQGGGRPLVELGGGDELRGARAYVTGDDWRHIHWPTTARLGQLVVREFERTGRSAVLVAWDGAAGSDWGTPPFSSSEIALTATISLVGALQNMAVPVVLWLGDAKSEIFDATALAGRELKTPVLEAFARARCERIVDFADAARHARAGHACDQIFLVTSSLRTDLLTTLIAWRARGLAVNILLVDAPAWALASGDKRFRPGKKRGAPVQNDGKNDVAVTPSAFDERERVLSAEGATVVRVTPDLNGDWRLGVERALAEILSR